jgi:phage shock protein A
MGIFRRLADVIKSNLNDLIDKAEDPEKMLEQMIREMDASYRTAKVEVAKAIADEKKIQQQYARNAEQAAMWEKKAMFAIQKGDDDLARQALKRKKSYDEIAHGFKAQLEDQSKMTDLLKDNLHGLEAKIEEAKRKKNLLIARAKRAEAQKTIHNAVSNINQTGAFDALARIEAKVQEIEIEQAAASELTDTGLESQFAALEVGSDIDDELESLKAKLLGTGTSSEPKLLKESQDEG